MLIECWNDNVPPWYSGQVKDPSFGQRKVGTQQQKLMTMAGDIQNGSKVNDVGSSWIVLMKIHA